MRCGKTGGGVPANPGVNVLRKGSAWADREGKAPLATRDYTEGLTGRGSLHASGQGRLCIAVASDRIRNHIQDLAGLSQLLDVACAIEGTDNRENRQMTTDSRTNVRLEFVDIG